MQTPLRFLQYEFQNTAILRYTKKLLHSLSENHIRVDLWLIHAHLIGISLKLTSNTLWIRHIVLLFSIEFETKYYASEALI